MGFTLSDSTARLADLRVRDLESFLLGLRSSGLAPKTMNRRMTSIRGFLQYLSEQRIGGANDLSLVQWRSHSGAAVAPNIPVRAAKSLSPEQLSQFLSLPKGSSCMARRDRAILNLFVDIGLRPIHASRLLVEDLKWNEPQPTLVVRISERRTHCVHIAADTAAAVNDYICAAGLSSGPLFRPADPGHRTRLANYGMSTQGFSHLLNRYLRLLPGSMRETTEQDRSRRSTCVFSPESLRVTAANNLLTKGVPISQIQKLLGHQHLKTTRAFICLERRSGNCDPGSRAAGQEPGGSTHGFEEILHNVAR
jgi:site-specific recombinase XerD